MRSMLAVSGTSQASVARVALFRLGTVLGLALSFSALELHSLAHTLPPRQIASTVLCYGHPTGNHVEAARSEDPKRCEVCLLGSRSKTIPLRASVALSQQVDQGFLYLTSPPRRPVGFQRIHRPRGPPLL